MKTIELKEHDCDFLKLICEQTPDGISIVDVRRSIRVIDAIEASDGKTLLLEDADYGHLMQRFGATKFLKADRTILDLFDRLQQAAR